MHTAFLANAAWWLYQAPAHRSFLHALGNPARAQERILRRLIRRHRATEFGAEHRFEEIRSIEAFQRRVPPRTYDDFLPYIERVLAGHACVLTRDPVRRLVPSSGSTAAAKWIPFTDTLRREFQNAVGPWVFSLYREQPDLLGGPSYWSITPAIEPPAVESALPLGFDADTAYLGGPWRRLVDATMAVPASISRITDIEEFQFRTLEALLRARALRLVSVWHPSFLLLLLARLADWWDRLLEAVRDPDLSRCDPRDYRRLWPRLGLISCWADGPAALHVGELRDAFPGVRIQPKGLLATEAVVSLPLGNARPLAVRSHFFEFQEDEGPIRLAHELRVDAEYSVVVTTGGGLYRYRLQDRVRVTGFVGRTPSLEFVGKEDRVADRFGEKLSEGFVSDALRRVVPECCPRPEFAMLAPDGPGYTLYVEADAADSPRLACELERCLRRNPHYDYCRRLGQLAPVRLYRIRGGAFVRFIETRRGQRLGNIKPVALSTETGWSEVFDGGYVDSTA